MRSKDEILAEMEALSIAVRTRYADARGEVPSMMHFWWMTAEEAARYHELRLSLPSFGEERVAAKQRIAARLAERKRAREVRALQG